MTTEQIKLFSQEAADRILSKSLERETEKLREALAAKAYPRAQRWAKQLAETVREINRTLEARVK